MRMSTIAALAALALAPLSACLSDDAKQGDVGQVDDADAADPDATDASVDPDATVVFDSVIDDDADATAVSDSASPTDVADTTAEDTEVVQSECGNGVLEANEACDDGNACVNDGCRAQACAPEPTVVLTSLALNASRGFDLDDADGDDDRYTGVDNMLGSNPAIVSQLNAAITPAIMSGQVIQLVTLAGLDDPTGDDDVDLVFHPGVEPACPPNDPPAWFSETGGGGPLPAVYSDSGAFEQCVPPLTIGDADDPDNGIYAATFSRWQGPAPLLYMSAASIALPTGVLGTIDVARSHLEATVQSEAGTLIGLREGELGGVIAAGVLSRIDLTGYFGQRCPTGLHGVLALLGQPDQDADGGGGIDFIQYTLDGSGTPCLDATVRIVACCDEGSCDGDSRIEGADCVTNPRIRDGYSAGFTFDARAVTVTGQVDGDAYCSDDD